MVVWMWCRYVPIVSVCLESNGSIFLCSAGTCYRIIQHDILEDHNIHINCCKNLTSHNITFWGEFSLDQFLWNFIWVRGGGGYKNPSRKFISGWNWSKMASTLQENCTMVAFVIRVIIVCMVDNFLFVTMVAMFTNITSDFVVTNVTFVPLLLWLPRLPMFFGCYVAQTCQKFFSVQKLFCFDSYSSIR